jgi:nitrate reductase gamma subunit
MTGIVWHIVTFGAIIFFLAIFVYRMAAFARLPIHLRWELAPIPHEKGKGDYGGSYLEEYEYWRQPRRTSIIAPVIYMLQEIFLLKGIWKNNRTLWPLSFSLHTGIYILVITLLLQVLNAVLIISKITGAVLNVTLTIAVVLALTGFILGGVGAIGLILKRAMDVNYRPFTTFTRYFHLVFLGLVFLSGIYAWAATDDFARTASTFIKDVVTLDSGITVAFPLSMHIIILLLFIIYLPLTDMVHFLAKFFTYHHVRWNDAPQDEKMTAELRDLLSQPVGWSAAHVPAEGQKSWAESTGGKKDNDKKTET